MGAIDLGEEVRARVAELAPDGPLGIAVSGGGDSMALLAIMAKGERPVAVATVDHGLRREARAEADLVAAFCAARGIPHAILEADLTGPGNLQARARDARFALLSDWARENGIATVLLAHTMDDQAETVLMRLARGSGIDGLAAMAPVRRWGGIAWVRPLLGMERARLRDWLIERGIGWAEDPSNQDPAFDRVRARKALAGLAPLGIDAAGLAATALRLSRQREVIEAAAAALWRTAVSDGALGELFLARRALAEAHPELALRVLSRALTTLSGAPYRPRLRALEPLLADMLAPDFAGRTLSGCRIHPMGECVEVTREPAAEPTITAEGREVLWDGRWSVGGAPPRVVIGPLGPDIHVTASHSGPPAWQGASRRARAATPAIRDEGGTLLAVPCAKLVLDPRAGAATATLCPGDAASYTPESWPRPLSGA